MLGRSVMFSLLDQLASVSGLFLFTALVSRSLSLDAFGTMSVMLAWASLLSALLQPALIDSSTVLGARAEGGRRDWGEIAIRIGLVVLASATGLCFALTAGMSSEFAVLGATVVASEAAVSLMALLRRFGYVSGPPWLGLMISLSNLGLTVLVVPEWLEASADVRHALQARLLINALTVVPIGLWLLRKQRMWSWRETVRGARQLLQFSRSYIGGSVIFWVTNSLQVVLIGHALSMADAAGYRAGQLLVLPATQLQSAIFQLVMPRVINRAQLQGFSVKRELPRLCALFGLPAVIYAVTLVVTSGFLLDIIFGSAYRVHRGLVVAMVFAAILDALKQVAVVLIYALDQKGLFMQYRMWALGLFVCGIAPALWWGNLMAFVLVSAVSSLVLLGFLAHQILRVMPAEGSS